MSQIYVGEEDAAAPAEPVNFPAELAAAAVDFAKAAALTVQEILNIVPRTLNLLPFMSAPELSFFNAAPEVVDNTRLEASLVQSFTDSAGSPRAGQVAAIAFSVFVLLYVPCMVAVSAMRHEFGARWMWAQIGFTLALAWTAAVLVFQVGRLIYA